MRLIFRVGVSLLIAALLTISILQYSGSINSFLQNSIAAQVLLIVLIVVDAIGVGITPWLESRISDTRERNKLLTKEIAKVEFDPSTDDEHILVIPPRGSESPYVKEVKDCLRNYPIWRLVEDLPIMWKNAKRTYDASTKEMQEELRNGHSTVNLAFSRESKDQVTSKLMERLISDLDKSRLMKYSPRRKDEQNLDSDVYLGGYLLAVPFSTAEKLAAKMTELNSLYMEKFREAKSDFYQALKGKEDFKKQRDAIVADITLHNYKNLKRTPWWKKLDR